MVRRELVGNLETFEGSQGVDVTNSLIQRIDFGVGQVAGKDPVGE
jgi:hypothetical protein